MRTPMKTSKILLAVALGTSGALLAAGLATKDVRAQGSTSGAIQGRVTDSVGGGGLAGVTVVVTGSSSQTAITEEDGSYRITDLRPGDYLVTFFFGDVTIERTNIKVGVNKTTPVFQKINTASAVQETIVIDDKPPAIDPTSTTQGITIDQDYTKNIPVPGRTFEATLGAAAGSQGDGVGVAFSGSSSLENQYVVDGVNTTGLRYGTVGSPIINDFIEEIEVITGGYNAEYGRATGGVVNVATLTGGNEFEGRVFAYVTPGQLTSSRDVAASEATSIDATSDLDLDANVGFTLTGPIIKDRMWFAVGVAPRYVQTTVTRTTKRQQDCQIRLPDGNLSACDPVMYQDGVADLDPGTGFHIFENLDQSKLRPHVTQLSTLAKVNFAVKPEHQGQVTFQASPSSAKSYGVYGVSTSMDNTQTGIGLDAGLKWTSKFNDSKTEVEAVLGWHRDQGSAKATNPGARHAPYEVLLYGNLGNWGNIMDMNGNPSESELTRAGCSDGPDDIYEFIPNCPDVGIGYRVGGLGFILDDTEDRYSAKLGVTRRQKFFGNHEIKAGVDAENNLLDEPRAYTGGVFFQNRQDANVILVNRFVQVGPADSTDPKFDAMCQYGSQPDQVRPCRYIGETGEGARVQGETLNWSAYLRDSWQIRPNLTVNAGLRYEEQRLRFAEYLRDETDPLTNRPFGTNAVVMKGMLAPRLGILYDWTREGRSKIYGHWGRFYESIPMNINSRSFAGEATFRQVLSSATCGADPGGFGGPSGNGCDLVTPTQGDILGLEGTAVAPGLKPQYMDETIAGVEYELMEDLKLGIAYQNRALGRVIEDVSTDGANTYIIANPGEWSADEERKLEQELMNAAGDPVEEARIENLLRQFRGIRIFDKPTRNYDALQFTVTRRFSKALYLQGSYTYSKTKGNYPGLISYDNGQVDPNISSQYDLIELLANRYGPLNQDRPHYIKLDGYYKFDLKKAGEITVGTRLRALSGIPRQAQASHWLYGTGESFLLPRGTIGRTQFETGIDLHLGYAKKLAKNMELELFTDLFNLVNNQGVAGVDDYYSFNSSSNPISGGSYEDLIFAKENDEGTGAETPEPIQRNPNYGNVNSRYSPRSFQFGARLSF
ncbi:MAG: TonB-dependent receptor [Myxococcales bacterium]|nr:TonB-dependent receptor [Myxococcales bacterium]